MECMIRAEVGRRRKEKCQNRRAEIHPESEENRSNTMHKRRRTTAGGEYKRVLAMSKPIREQEMLIEEEQNNSKRRKLEEQPRTKFLGQVMKGYILEEPINWEEERRKRQEYIENEERQRQERIRKARRLEESWKLSNLCREFIREHSQVWQVRAEDQRLEKEDAERAERVLRAKHKQEKYKEGQLLKEKNRKITDMLLELPRDEQEKFKREKRREEGAILKEIKDNMWKRWRGKARKNGKLEEIPKEEEKLDAQIMEIEQRVEEYRQEKRRVEERKDKKRKLEEHWQMMRWLTRYIEENRYTWERRRLIQEEESQMNENYDEWMNKEADDQIRDLMMSKDQEDRKEVEQRKRMEKAKARRKLWKEWRWRNEAADDDDERDQVIDDEGLKEHEGSKEHAEEVLHQGEAVGEPPGQDNSLHKAGVLPKILGGEEPGSLYRWYRPLQSWPPYPP